MRNAIIVTILLFKSFASFAQNGVEQVAPVPPAMDNVADGLVNEVDKMPEFPGGRAKLYSFLSSNLNYPEEARDNELQGRVVVDFTVCEDGSLCDERIVNSFDKGCSKEVLRVVSKMPAWKPAEKDGKKVKTRYRLPVSFQLEEPEPFEIKTE